MCFFAWLGVPPYVHWFHLCAKCTRLSPATSSGYWWGYCILWNRKGQVPFYIIVIAKCQWQIWVHNKLYTNCYSTAVSLWKLRQLFWYSSSTSLHVLCEVLWLFNIVIWHAWNCWNDCCPTLFVYHTRHMYVTVILVANIYIHIMVMYRLVHHSLYSICSSSA